MNKKQDLVLITGGSSGIGKTLMMELANRGYRVLITGRNKEKLHSIETEMINKNIMTMVCNVSEEKDVKDLFDRIHKCKDVLRVVINSAGISKAMNTDRVIPYPTSELPLSEWNDILKVNLRGIFMISKEAIKIMKNQNSGQIINIGSALSRDGMVGQPYAQAYSASKFGVLGLGEAIAEEAASYGITVQTICPGLVKTPLTENTALSTLFGGKYIKAENIAFAIAEMIEINKVMKTNNPHYIPQ